MYIASIVARWRSASMEYMQGGGGGGGGSQQYFCRSSISLYEDEGAGNLVL